MYDSYFLEFAFRRKYLDYLRPDQCKFLEFLDLKMDMINSKLDAYKRLKNAGLFLRNLSLRQITKTRPWTSSRTEANPRQELWSKMSRKEPIVAKKTRLGDTLEMFNGFQLLHEKVDDLEDSGLMTA